MRIVPAVLRGLVLVLVAALLALPGRAEARDDLPAAGARVAQPVEARARGCANGRPSQVYGDRRDDGPRGVDVAGLGVWNKRGDACYWATVTGRFTARKAQVIRLIIDTRGDRRYEYQAFAYSQKDGDNRRGAFLVTYYEDGQGHIRSQYVPCRLFSTFLVGQGQIRLGIPKTCLGSPPRIRLQAAVFDITRYQSGNRWRGLVDQVPQRGYTRRF
ncbi:hypothetical protein ABFT23_18475 [Nocardioides sp. C4-1]|uniref:hypothetical protein n=1 Tax=Nocardioides sp. C4-1 TaxID=3151851 RepID=UPI003264A68B